ncbi:hypothetical protein [Leucothrix arctica]|uniref:DUF883 domain-containing protein n=1 Tax=Leucothrix arctica TaxID=1481894 RepID=A0A317CAN5_9GAMM|nr:hypothetical protein [Leucothrix arctica]PWQ95684.1 hypothetical protein DKT75_11665 [Leucothrix arctica]
MGRNQTKPQTVEEAKQKLRATSQQLDYLAPVKKHPVASVGAAFVAGMLIRKVGIGSFPPSLLSIGFQLLKKL